MLVQAMAPKMTIRAKVATRTTSKVHLTSQKASAITMLHLLQANLMAPKLLSYKRMAMNQWMRTIASPRVETLTLENKETAST